MSNRHTRTLSSLLATAFLAFPLISYADDVLVLRGQLQAGPRVLFDGFFVAMEGVTEHHELHRVDVSVGGGFEFHAVPTGEYVLRVTDLHGDTVHQEYVTVQPHMSEITVRMPEPRPRPSAPGTVSLTQLRHPPDRKAIRAFTAATKLSESGSYSQAVEELEKAIRISPEFSDAYTNLAVQHIRLRRFEEAAAESERAMQIAGPDSLNLCNLAFAQFQLRRFEQAAASARAALRLDSGYLQAHLVLGAVLANDPATRAEAMQHLELAAERFPSARINLERLRAAPR